MSLSRRLISPSGSSVLEGKNVCDRLLLSHLTPAQIKWGGGGGVSYMKTVPWRAIDGLMWAFKHNNTEVLHAVNSL